MTLLQLIACVGMTAGAFLLFQISPMQFTDGLFRFLTRKPKNIRDEINEVTKPNGFPWCVWFPCFSLFSASASQF